MEYVLPIVLFTVVYGIIGMINFAIGGAPEFLTPAQQTRYMGHRISFLHSAIALIFGSCIFYCDNGLNYDEPTTQAQHWLLAHSMGYFTYDIIISEIKKVHDLTLRLHHYFVFLGGLVLYTAARVCMLCGEISNPPMQIRHMLKDAKREKEAVYKYNEIIFAVLFLVNRGCIAPIFLYNAYFYDVPMLLQRTISILVAMSWVWNIVILSMLAKKLKESNDKPSAPVKFFLETMHLLKKFKYPVMALIYAWLLFFPDLMRFAGFGPFHMRLGTFNIV